MPTKDKPIKKRCKLFKLLGDDVPDFCEKHFIPKVEWHKFCSNENKCHDEYWRIIYQEKKIVNKRLEDADKRLEKLEKEAGLSK